MACHIVSNFMTFSVNMMVFITYVEIYGDFTEIYRIITAFKF